MCLLRELTPTNCRTANDDRDCPRTYLSIDDAYLPYHGIVQISLPFVLLLSIN